MNITTNGHSVTDFRTDFDADQCLIDTILKRLKDDQPLTVEDIYRASFKGHWPPNGLRVNRNANKTPVKIVIQKNIKGKKGVPESVAQYLPDADEIHLNAKHLMVRKSGIALLMRNMYRKFISAKRSTFGSVAHSVSHEATHGQSHNYATSLLNPEFIRQHVIDPGKGNPAFNGMKAEAVKDAVYLSSIEELLATLQELCPLAYEFSPHPREDFFKRKMPTDKHSFITMMKRCGVNIAGDDVKAEQVFAGANYEYYSSIFDGLSRKRAHPIAELVNARIMPVIRAMPDKKDREIFMNNTLPYLYGLLVEYWGDGAGRHYMGYGRDAAKPFVLKQPAGMPPGYFKPTRTGVTLFPRPQAGESVLALSF